MADEDKTSLRSRMPWPEHEQGRSNFTINQSLPRRRKNDRRACSTGARGEENGRFPGKACRVGGKSALDGAALEYAAKLRRAGGRGKENWAPVRAIRHAGAGGLRISPKKRILAELWRR